MTTIDKVMKTIIDNNLQDIVRNKLIYAKVGKKKARLKMRAYRAKLKELNNK